MGQTLTEKILSRVTGAPVAAGDVIYPVPELITVHDGYVIPFHKDLKEFGVDRLFAPEKVVICTDHNPMATTVEGAQQQKTIRKIAADYGVERFYDVGRGGHGHIFPMEAGFVRPGQFALGYDMHIANFGAVGALGIYLVAEITEVLACGTVWIRVPETVRVNLHGRLSPGVSARDISQRIVADLDEDLLDYAVVEYGGPAFEHIGFSGRMTLCNSPLESSAKSAIVEVDDLIVDWAKARKFAPFPRFHADADATYRSVIDVDVSDLAPQVAVPPNSTSSMNVGELLGIQIHHASVGSCANGGIDDLRDAAKVLRGRKVADGVRMVVTPGTQEIAAQSAREGLLEVFAEAGVSLTAPGCGVCAGGRVSSVAAGEVSINTGTVNSPGRLGSKDATIYLASPMTVAASAVMGRIEDPRSLLR